LLCLLVTVVAVLGGLPRLRDGGLPIDFTPQALFNQDKDNAEILALTTQAWGRDDNDVWVLIEGPIFTQQGLDLVTQVHQAVSELAIIARVDSLASLYIPIRQVDGSVQILPLLDAGSPREIRTLAASQPGVLGLFAGQAGQLAMVRAHMADELESVTDIKPGVDALKDAIGNWDIPDGYQISLSGIPTVRVELVDLLKRDQAVFFPLDTLIFALVLVVLYRRPFPGLLPLFAVGVAVLWSTGLLLAGGVTFNILSSLVPTLVLVIGVSDGIHLLTRYQEELRLDRDRIAAMGRTIQQMGVACALTSLTTAIGFGSLASSSSVAIRDFGLQASLSVMVAYCAVLFVLPTTLAWVPVRWVLGAGGDGSRRRSRVSRFMLVLDAVVARRPGRVLGVCLVISAAALALGASVRTTSHMMEVFDSEHPAVATYSMVVANLGGIIPVMAHLEAPEGTSFRDPDMLKRLGEFTDLIRAHPDVGWGLSGADLIASLHGALTGTVGLPNDSDVLDQELMLAEWSGEELGLNTLFDVDYRQARVMALSPDLGGHAFVALGKDMAAMGERVFEGTGVTVLPAGDGIVASAGIHRLIDDLIISVLLAFVGIWLTLCGLFRNVRLASLAMIPNALPLIFTLASLRLMGENLQTGNVISFAVALGLAVDDTIHFLARLQEEHARGRSLKKAIRHAFRGAGTAMVYTSLLLTLGLGVMAGSDLVTTRHFALLACATMGAALFADLLVLPALLHLLGPKRLGMGESSRSCGGLLKPGPD
jgi:predicted RND superfamily exporter protein